MKIIYIVNNQAGTYKNPISCLYLRAKFVFLIINDSNNTPQKAKFRAPKAITFLSSLFDNIKYPKSSNAFTKNK